jgi:serine/threonine protein kinase
MNPERWRQVKELLDEALAVESSERSSLLDQACAGDTELRGEVESLLASHQQAGTGFLKTPAMDLTSVPRSPVSRVGRRIGVYQLIEEIGHGGMGEVYRAVRADGQYTKEVAVKLVRGGFDSRFALERFRNERQILASLDHPNIARLLDGGTTDDGIPYLVMELIEGKPIDVDCDERKLSITGRMRLFREVCGAVQYAHQRLVIHRDIKPSNILVTREGTPKLLDFGIAKLLDPTGDAQTTLSQAMTPEYASPEQIRGEPITTATDVYSLGVVLYQLLTARSPYPGVRRSTHELARAVCETEPGRPSTAVLKLQPARADLPIEQQTPEQVSSSREGSPARLHRRLAGDLDDIVLMALRKEPQHRYASVEQFAEDIRRHLDGLPVSASKGSWSYRAGKFVRRQKAAMTAAALVLVTLATGVTATVRQARIARHQAEIAHAERARAERRFNDVRKLANSLIFEIHDSIQNLPGATPSRKLLLDRAVEYLDKLSQDSAGDVDLQRELAWGYQRLSAVQGDTSQSNLGEISAAEASTRKAMALFEAVAKVNPQSVADQINLAMAYRRRAFADIYERSGPQEIEQALAVTEPLMRTNAEKPEVRNERSLELNILGSVQDATGYRLKAIDTYRQALDLRRDILRANPGYKGIRRGVANATIVLAYHLGRFGNRDEAMQFMNQGISQYQALVKEGGDPDVKRDLAASQLRRGEVALLRGDTAAAIADFRLAREATARLVRLDPENKMLQSDVCGFDFEEGRALTTIGKTGEGLRLSQKALQCFRNLHLEGDTGPGTGALETWVGEGHARLGNFPEALKHFQNAVLALKGDLNKYDDARCDLATVQTKIGDMLRKMGRSSDASAAYSEAINIGNLAFSLDHKDIPALYAIADAYAGLGDLAIAGERKTQDPSLRSRLVYEARKSYEQSLSIWKQIPNPSRISGNGYLVRDGKEIAQQLSALTHDVAHSGMPRAAMLPVVPAWIDHATVGEVPKTKPAK